MDAAVRLLETMAEGEDAVVALARGRGVDAVARATRGRIRSFEPSVKGEPHPCHMPVVVFEADILRARLASANAHTRVRARRSTYSPVGHLLNQTETEHFEKTTAETRA